MIYFICFILPVSIHSSIYSLICLILYLLADYNFVDDFIKELVSYAGTHYTQYKLLKVLHE